MTAKELAQKLNLSAAAVSMALNNKPGVSTETRNRVLEAAQTYGLDLSKFRNEEKKQGVIDLIYYRKSGAVLADTPFFSELAEAILETCKNAGYTVNIKYIYDTEDVQTELQTLINLKDAGFLIMGTEMQPEDIQPLAFLNIPIVLLDNRFLSSKLDFVKIANEDAAYLATNYIIHKRRTQPGYLHSSYSISNFEERAEGFYRSLLHHGMAKGKSPVHLLVPSVEGAYGDMLEIIRNGEELAGCYFADNDLIAVGAIKALRECGYRIPEDIGIVGFDDLPVGTYMDPALTTVHVPKKYMGRIAAERLIDIIEHKSHYPVTIEISTNLIKRGSL